MGHIHLYVYDTGSFFWLLIFEGPKEFRSNKNVYIVILIMQGMALLQNFPYNK